MGTTSSGSRLAAPPDVAAGLAEAEYPHRLLVVRALKDAGIYDDAAIFFFSDHGDFTGDYGLVERNQNTFEDCLVRTPLVVKPPGWLPCKPGVRDALVELTDFTATVEAMCGLEPAHTHFGRSLLPVIAGGAEVHRDAVFAEGGRLAGETHCMELESVSSQSPDGLYYPRLAAQRQEGPAHTKATMLRTQRFKYIRRLYELDELYDLVADPQELTNRIDDPELAAILCELKDRMLTFYLETADVVPHEVDSR